MKFKGREIQFPRRPLIMGIINVNDDSFCDDGSLDPEVAIQQSIEMVNLGADVIDVGAESARTNREAISVAEEVERFISYLSKWDEVIQHSRPRDEEQVWPPILSINTWRPEVVEQVLPSGGDWLNDMSALPTDRNAQSAAQNGAALLIMHSVGEPKVPHTHQQWTDVVGSMVSFFKTKVELAIAAGVPKCSLILDPGIDFAKQKEDNLEVYRNLKQLLALNIPILLPVSRKTVVGDVLGIKAPQQRDAGSMACIVQGVIEGVHCFRVHNVQATFDVVKTCHETAMA